MGIYTNAAFSGYSSSDYTSVEPFKGDHFNYHELGIIAAAESAANQNAFMKAIALQELASMEQYGNTDVLYESVNIKGIFEKIKAFFKKIIEKIHKIFHTFVAKMQSWFGNNKSFAQKYEKEIIKNWSKVSNDFEFKGWKFKKDKLLKEVGESKNELKVGSEYGELLKNALSNGASLTTLFEDGITATEDANIRKLRDDLDDIKDHIRKQIIDEKSIDFLPDIEKGPGLDAKEFTEELVKIFRDEDKDDLNKSAIVEMYGGSINSMMTFIKDYEKIKTNLEKSEKKITSGIDKLISDMNKAENDLTKVNRDESKKEAPKDANNPTSEERNDTKIKGNEAIIQTSSIYQSIWGFIKECYIQYFSAYLQATKDACAQAKEIAVKVIGLNKKMTESADYSDDGNTTSTAFGGDFISSVKLV